MPALTKVTSGLVGVCGSAPAGAGGHPSVVWSSGPYLPGLVPCGVDGLAGIGALLALSSDGDVARNGLPWVTLTFLALGLAVSAVAALTRRDWLLAVATILVSPTSDPTP